MVTQSDTRGCGVCTPFPCTDAHSWIRFPTSILLRKKQHEKRHHQAILLVTKGAGPRAAGFERKSLHCFESWEPVLGSQAGELGFQEPQLTLLLAQDKRWAWLNPWPRGGFPARGGHGGPAEAALPTRRGGADFPSPSDQRTERTCTGHCSLCSCARSPGL